MCKKATSENITNFLTFKILNKKKKFEAFPISYYSIDGEKTAFMAGPILEILLSFFGRRPGARKGGGVLLGTGPLERDEENTRSFSVRLEAVFPQWWVIFGEGFLFSRLGSSNTRKVGTKVGVFFFFGENRGGKKWNKPKK